jgi:hypothetical protein
VPPTNTPKPPTPKPKPTATPTVPAPPPFALACCSPPEPGQGLLWFENWVGEAIQTDIGKGDYTTYYEVPAKVGDEAGCLCLSLDPGRWTIILKTHTHRGTFEVDIEAGRVVRFPIGYRDH